VRGWLPERACGRDWSPSLPSLLPSASAGSFRCDGAIWAKPVIPAAHISSCWGPIAPLTLADPVSMYFPQLANLQVTVANKDADGKTTYTLVKAERPITVQDLLRHTSGFVYGGFTPNEQVKAAYSKLGVDWQDVTPAEQIERMSHLASFRVPVFFSGFSILPQDRSGKNRQLILFGAVETVP